MMNHSDSVGFLTSSGHGPDGISPLSETPASEVPLQHHGAGQHLLQQHYDAAVPGSALSPSISPDEPTARHPHPDDGSSYELRSAHEAADGASAEWSQDAAKERESFATGQPPRPSGNVFKSWAWELLGAIFSIIFLAAMVTILARINGTLLSSWTVFLSPNTVISVLSTASKATIILPVAEGISQLKWLHLERRSLGLESLQIFDDASRGPSGAFWFFWKAGKGASFVAYLGCLLTIMAVALDPFTQQILSYEQIPTRVEGISSTVTRSQIYDNQMKGVNGVGDVLGPTRDPLLQQAAFSGLYDLVQPPPFTCPGSNCTYPAFTSLGIASTCENVTAHVTQDCVGDVVQTCNYTLPRGYEIGAQSSMSAHSGFAHTTLNTEVNPVGIDDTTDNQSMSVNLINFGLIMFTSDDLEDTYEIDHTWQSTVTAYECRFDLSVYTYSNWTSTNGTINPGEMVPSNLSLVVNDLILPWYVTDSSFTGDNTFGLNYDDLQLINSILYTIFAGSDSNSVDFDALFTSSNITATVANIAKGMSYRMLSGPNATVVEGDVFAVQTYIRVHWAWLSLSGALLVVACGFFGTVVVQTARARQLAWKSSLAPLLYIDLGSWEGVEGFQDVASPEGYEALRKNTIFEQLRWH